MKQFIIGVLILPWALSARELPIPQESPGPYELKLVTQQNTEESPYSYVFVNKSDEKILGFTELVSSYDSAEVTAKNAGVCWHSSGKFVAFTSRGTRQTSELHIYSLENEKPVRLEFPDFMQNALGRVDAVQTSMMSLVSPVSWQDDQLTLKYQFSVKDKAEGRRSYETTVVLRLIHGNQTVPSLRLDSVEPPTPSQN